MINEKENSTKEKIERLHEAESELKKEYVSLDDVGKDFKGMDFIPPKIPLAFIASSILAPALVGFLPYLLDIGKQSLPYLVALAACLMAVMFFTLFLTTYFRLYNEAYKRQIAEFIQEIIRLRLDKISEFNTGAMTKTMHMLETALITDEELTKLKDESQRHFEELDKLRKQISVLTGKQAQQ